MTSSKNILLVEDNPDDEALTLRALKKSKMTTTIVVVRDGAEASEWLFGLNRLSDRDPTRAPQLILLDLSLPKVDGLEVLRQIRADSLTRLLPVVIFSSSDEQKDLINSYNRGANSYIRKPMEFAEFVNTIQQLSIIYWLTLNKAPSAPQK